MAADGAPPFALGTFARDGERFPGLAIGERVHDLRPALGPHATTRSLLEDWEESFARLRELAAGDLGSGTPVADLRVEVPIEPPGQVLCAGANYRRHLAQMHFAFERRAGSALSDDELRALS